MAYEDILRDFAVFVDGKGYAGEGEECKLPEIKLVVEELEAGGLAAGIDVPMGRVEKLTSEFTLARFDSTVLRAFKVVDGQTLPFVVRGSLASQDGTTKPAVATMTGLIVEHKHGDMKPGKKAGSTIKLSLRYYKLEVDGQSIIEIDPINKIIMVDGEDQLAEMRAHLGM
jgi:P2 family phage contractile tail tube protein